MADNSIARSVHELGLAAWFGGSLMGAVGVNQGAARQADRDASSSATGAGDAAAGAGWQVWTPVNLVAIGMYVAGGVILTTANRGRLAGQSGVASAALVKAGLSAAALGATAYARVLGQRVIAEETKGDADRSDPAVDDAWHQLRVLQWAIPALTGALIVTNSVLGEQQRPSQVAGGIIDRLRH